MKKNQIRVNNWNKRYEKRRENGKRRKFSQVLNEL